jgi:hypothetical protein
VSLSLRPPSSGPQHVECANDQRIGTLPEGEQDRAAKALLAFAQERMDHARDA